MPISIGLLARKNIKEGTWIKFNQADGIEIWTACEVLKMQQDNFHCSFGEIMKALFVQCLSSAYVGVCNFGPKNPKRAVALKPSLICIQEQKPKLHLI